MSSLSTHASSSVSTKRIVIKVGTSTLISSHPETGSQRVNMTSVGRLVDCITALRDEGHQVILVSSAAVGFGCLRLNLKERPKDLYTKQAVAAAGQSHLMRLYEDQFGIHNVHVAQILLSRFDISAKGRFENFENSMNELLKMGVLPILNENDYVAVEELMFGDNDTLSALVATSLQADHLFLLTDVDYLYDDNPRTNPNASALLTVAPEDLATGKAFNVSATGGTQWGTGGMATKISAAKTATCAGCQCTLVNGAEPERVRGLLDGSMDPSDVGTIFLPMLKEEEAPLPLPNEISLPSIMTQDRRWILSLPVKGTIVTDLAGALDLRSKKSLLVSGVEKVLGGFDSNDCVSVCALTEDDGVSTSGSGASPKSTERALVEIGRALVNFSASEVEHMLEEEVWQGSPKLACREISNCKSIVITSAPTEEEIEELQTYQALPSFEDLSI